MTNCKSSDELAEMLPGNRFGKFFMGFGGLNSVTKLLAPDSSVFFPGRMSFLTEVSLTATATY